MNYKAVKFYIILLCYLFLFFTAQSFAQKTEFDSLIVTGTKQIYSINFSAAEKTFQTLTNRYPNHPAGKFFLAMIYWWRIILDPSYEGYDDIFVEKLEEVIEQCDNILDKDPDNIDAIFFKGGSIGFRGRLAALRDSWLSAADDGREALPLVQRAGELDSNNVDVQLGFGIYNYYADVIPEKYPVVKPLMLFIPSGDKELGVKQLKNVAANGKYAKYEARYFLMTLYFRYENNADSAEVYSKLLNDDFPDNPVFERWRGRIAVRHNKLALADSIFKDVLIKAGKRLPGYNMLKVKREAVYYIGFYYRSLKQYDSAQVYFEKCVDYSRKVDKDEASGYMINSTLYLGMIKEMNEEYIAAKMYYEKILDMREFGNSHKLAEEYLERIEKQGQ